MEKESGMHVPRWYFDHVRSMSINEFVMNTVMVEANLSQDDLKVGTGIMLALMEYPEIAFHRVSISQRESEFHLVTTDDNVDIIESLCGSLTPYIKDGLHVKDVTMALDECLPHLLPVVVKPYDKIMESMMDASDGREVPVNIGKQYRLTIMYKSQNAGKNLLNALITRRENETEENT